MIPRIIRLIFALFHSRQQKMQRRPYRYTYVYTLGIQRSARAQSYSEMSCIARFMYRK